MSTVSLAACTLIFTGATMDEVHSEMSKYLSEQAIHNEKDVAKGAIPKPFKVETQPYVKNMSRTEFDNWSKLTGEAAERYWNVYQSLQDWYTFNHCS